ncbi:MAG: AraC family transcriptional regulator [Chitinophagaceae bacterium]
MTTTYYHTQVLRLHKSLYSKEDLTEQIMQSKLFIDEYFANHLSLDDLARKAFLSKFHFIRIFKKMYGKTPYQHLVSVRIKEAKKLLHTDMPVAEVCLSVGFDSPTSFAALFRKMTGYTPSAFRHKKAILKS